MFSQDLEDLQKSMGKFSDSMAKALPFNSSIGLNWSDAYIGQLLAFPPHFGIGVTAGLTTLDAVSVNSLLNLFGTSMPFSDVDFLKSIGLPLPAYTVDLRLGGIKLPFDIGIKASYIPENLIGNMIDSFDFGLNYLLVGADFRYSFTSKRKILPFRVSAGIGVNYMEGGVNTTLPADSFNFTFSGSDNNKYTIIPDEAKIGLEWKTINAEIKAHISFPFKFVTPYAGAGVSYAMSEAGFKLISDLTVKDSSNNDKEISEVEDDLKGYGLSGISNKGFGSTKKIDGINTRVYGGASLNLFVVRLDLTAMYEILGGNLGATVGFRFQL